jgi:hypothetical protein
VLPMVDQQVVAGTEETAGQMQDQVGKVAMEPMVFLVDLLVETVEMEVLQDPDPLAAQFPAEMAETEGTALTVETVAMEDGVGMLLGMESQAEAGTAAMEVWRRLAESAAEAVMEMVLLQGKAVTAAQVETGGRVQL